MVHPHDLFSPVEPWTIRIVRLAEELVRKGHRVQLLHFPLPGSQSRNIGEISVVALEREITPSALARNTGKVRALLSTSDIVHLQKSHFYAALPVILAAYATARPIHYDWDDWEEKIFYRSIHRRTLSVELMGLSFRMLERFLPYWADSVSVSSEKLRDLAYSFGARPERVVLAPVGASPEMFHTGLDASALRERYGVGERLLVLYHGQLHSCQYVSLLLEAIRWIYDRSMGDRLLFMIVGSGSELESLKEYAAKIGISDRVIFTGAVPHDEIPMYVAAADVCVAPFEDNEVTRCKSPLKIVEYLSAGKPIVASDVGEVRVMLDGGSGLLVEPDNLEAFAQGIIELADDEERRIAMSALARQKASTRYNWRWSANNIESAYEQSVRAQ